MAVRITEECTACGSCVESCPNEAIFKPEDDEEERARSLTMNEYEIYVADPLLCNECVGFFEREQCMEVCPVDAVILDPENVESEAELIARARSLHPEKKFGEKFKSRFRA